MVGLGFNLWPFCLRALGGPLSCLSLTFFFCDIRIIPLCVDIEGDRFYIKSQPTHRDTLVASLLSAILSPPNFWNTHVCLVSHLDSNLALYWPELIYSHYRLFPFNVNICLFHCQNVRTFIYRVLSRLCWKWSGSPGNGVSRPFDPFLVSIFRSWSSVGVSSSS